MRIASLLPSATETLFALGLGESIVGVTHECDFPSEASTKPPLMRPRVDPLATPAALDCQVRALVERGESLYEIKDDLLCSLAPDLIITQDLCHVCAASPGDLVSALARLSSRPTVLSLEPKTLKDVWNDFQRIGAATGRTAEADRLVARLETRLAQIDRAVAHAAAHPRVLCLEWLDPFYVGGHWIPEMVTRAGGVDLFGRAGIASFRVTSDEVMAAQPELIIAMPCGYSLIRTCKEYRRASFPAGWIEIPAVRSGNVFAVDANSYFSRSGPRLVEGVAIIARMIHPESAIADIPEGSYCRVESFVTSV